MIGSLYTRAKNIPVCMPYFSQRGVIYRNDDLLHTLQDLKEYCFSYNRKIHEDILFDIFSTGSPEWDHKLAAILEEGDIEKKLKGLDHSIQMRRQKYPNADIGDIVDSTEYKILYAIYHFNPSRKEVKVLELLKDPNLEYFRLAFIKYMEQRSLSIQEKIERYASQGKLALLECYIDYLEDTMEAYRSEGLLAYEQEGVISLYFHKGRWILNNGGSISYPSSYEEGRDYFVSFIKKYKSSLIL